MGALSYDGLLRTLKPGARLDPVYYFHGDEDVLKDEAVRALVELAVDPSVRDFNVDRPSAADLDPDAFLSLVNTPPMLAPVRVVVLRGIEELKKTSKARQALLAYLAAPSTTTVLVLVQNAGTAPDPELARAATAVAANPLPPHRVLKWLAHRARRLKLGLGPDAAELLVATCGTDLGQLAQELEKLAALAVDRPATRDDVAAVVGMRHGETLQDFVDAALERRAADAARLLEPVLSQAGMSGVRMLMALGTALVGTALARAELDLANARTRAPSPRIEAAVLSVLRAARPWGVGSWQDTAVRWARWATLWTADELRAALRLALTADRALKSSTVTDERGILMQLVLACGVRAREAA